jgi:protocatechuate 3,4-dioxygenase beta subunit
MSFRRRLGAAALLFLSACVGSEPSAPAIDSNAPSAAIVDGSTTGSSAFYFLPPLVDNPTPVGTFNADLAPAMLVCTLVGTSCAVGDTVAYFPAGSFEATSDKYQLNWDTDGPETSNMQANKNYQLQILVGGLVMGSLDLDPQNPNGPGQSTAGPGFYAFRLGETIPVKFWLSDQVLCDVDGVIVLECITNAVLDENGGALRLDQAGDPLEVLLPEGALPGLNHPPVLVTVERIDPDEFFATEGVECIPLFDAPQFGPCFRVTTTPPLSDPLDEAALISICVDLHDLPVHVSHVQEHQLQITRFATDGSGVVQGLAGTAGACPTETASLFDVPDDGFMRYAALAANWVADVVGPTPAQALNIRLGGLTSSFSRFRFALPGQMTVTAGNGAVIQGAGDPDVPVTILVLDQAGVPVQNARVHFPQAQSDGTTSAQFVMTDVDGLANVTWTVDTSTPGTKTLTASAFGLKAGPVPEHSNAFIYSVESITVNATVVGPPAVIATTPTDDIAGVAGGEVGPISIVVTDAAGNPVAGAGVTWQGDGTVAGDALTDASGSASGLWTLPTTAGANTMNVNVGDISASFTATGAAGPAAALLFTGDGQTAGAGSALPLPLTVRVVDQYGNGRAGDVVTWSVLTGGGSIVGGTPTGVDGSASATWTLGAIPGANTASAAVGALSHIFGATGACSQGYGQATVDGQFGTEWACANSMPFIANVSGGNAQAVAYWMNNGTNLYLAVRVQRSALDRVNSLRFDFDNDGDGVTELNDDAIGYDSETRTFLDQFLTAKCLNSNQAGCGGNDTIVNGQGQAANDGTWTTYELSHPLSGGGVQDISRAPGQSLGFYLTLRIGGGAQGNTQVPGFRIYQPITLAAP